MEKGLAGKRIAIGGSRKIEEICTLIEKQGGVPLVRPLQGIVFLAEDQVKPDLVKFVQEGADWVIFTTGIGTETLLNLAEKLGVDGHFFSRIREAKVASRGYKTLSSLKKLEINPVAMDEDGTTRSLIHSLERFDFSGRRVMVQLHGETAPSLIKFLEDRGASVLTILPYEHIPPEVETVARLCKELLLNECEAVCFTTAIQVRSLFEYARKSEILTEITATFRENVMAVAVGKVTAEALREERIERFLVPDSERMGAMIIELSHYYKN